MGKRFRRNRFGCCRREISISPEYAGMLLGFIIGFCSGFIVCGFWAMYERMKDAERKIGRKLES